MSPLPAQMTDHWWWRPGCRPGRRQYVWHILLDDQPALRKTVRELQARLARLPGLDLVPADWLHMTTYVAGFADEISEAEASDMAARASRKLQATAPAEVTFGRVLFHSEAVMLAPLPAGVLDPIRAAVVESAADVLGHERMGDTAGWVPHVTAAYSNAATAAEPVIRAAGREVAASVAVISRVHLVAQERVGHAYRWEPIAALNLGGCALR